MVFFMAELCRLDKNRGGRCAKNRENGLLRRAAAGRIIKLERSGHQFCKRRAKLEKPLGAASSAGESRAPGHLRLCPALIR